MRVHKCPGCLENEIWDHHSLCTKCGEKYGYDPKKWPEWLKFLHSDNQHEANRRRRHPTVPLSETAIENLAAARRHPEMDFEDFLWSVQ